MMNYVLPELKVNTVRQGLNAASIGAMQKLELINSDVCGPTEEEN
jgi:hypothetical protein